MTAPYFPSALPLSADSLNVGVLTDLHLGIRPEVTNTLLGDGDFLRAQDHIVLLGDQAAAWGAGEEYEAIGRFLCNLNLPYSAVTGNHEFYFEVVTDPNVPGGRVFKQASPEFKAQRLREFAHFYGQDQLWSAQRTPLGLFLHFCLDNIYHPRPEALSEQAQQFLLNQLMQAGEVPVFVFCHAPLSLGTRLDMIYYEPDRTACVELNPAIHAQLQALRAPLFWISGHVHLHPDHHLYTPYQLTADIWQVHCPDGLGYSRWTREQVKPEMHDELFSRSLRVSPRAVEFITRDHVRRQVATSHVIPL